VISREPGLSGQGVLLHSDIVLLNVPIDLDGLFAVQWRDSDGRVVVVVLAHPPETILLLDRIDTGFSRRGDHHHHKRSQCGANHGRTMAERCTITRAFTRQSHRIKRMIDQASQPCLWSANPDVCQSRVSPISRAGRFADTDPVRHANRHSTAPPDALRSNKGTRPASARLTPGHHASRSANAWTLRPARPSARRGRHGTQTAINTKSQQKQPKRPDQ